MKRLLPSLLLLAYLVFFVSKLPTFQFFGKLIPRVETSQRVVALTFDDGPTSPHTTRLLELLDRLQVKATFFMIGKQIEKHPEFARAVANAGHQLANHTYSNRLMMFKTPEFIRSDIEKADELIRDSGYSGEIFFRPPSGLKFLVLPYVLSKLGKTTITWDVSSKDYKRPPPQETAQFVVNEVTPGSIVLLHDTSEETVEATAKIIADLKAQGYSFKTVSELLAYSER